MRHTAAVLLAVLAACAAPDRGAADSVALDTGGAAPRGGSAAPDTTGATTLELHTDKERYAPGATMTLTVVNGTDRTYAFNPCTRMVQKEGSGDWPPVDEPQRVCTMEAWLLEPRSRRSGDTELPATLEAGRHRIGLSMSIQGTAPATEYALVVSKPFTVSR